jgi:thioredoxin:protein disulfide reductase
MGLVAAPCIGPFIVALLAYVAARGDAAAGFFLFLSLGIGLGLPYLPLALAADAFARWPRAGAVLILAKRLLGFALFALALWFLVPMIGLDRFRYGIEFLAIIAGIAILAWPVIGESSTARGARRIIAVVLVLLPILFRGTQPPAETKIGWRPFSNALLAEAAANRKPVVVDVTAAWCLPCQEMDAITFSDPGIIAAFDDVVALKADVTGPEISSDAQNLVEKTSVRGVPTVLFFDPSGRERSDLRLEGFEPPSRFGLRLQTLISGETVKPQE